MTVSSVTLNVPLAAVFACDRHRCVFDVDLDDLTRNAILDIRRLGVGGCRRHQPDCSQCCDAQHASDRFAQHDVIPPVPAHALRNDIATTRQLSPDMVGTWKAECQRISGEIYSRGGNLQREGDMSRHPQTPSSRGIELPASGFSPAAAY